QALRGAGQPEAAAGPGCGPGPVGGVAGPHPVHRGGPGALLPPHRRHPRLSRLGGIHAGRSPAGTGPASRFGHRPLGKPVPMASHLRCLVTGATGYIGGRLAPELLEAGYTVRCMARDPGKLADRPWSDDVEVATADVTNPGGLHDALTGCDVAYYLIHSLGTGSSFEQLDRDAARAFADAARAAGVRRIVYLGGMISGKEGDLSPHLRSRAEVGDILLGSGVPTAALQAAVIIGSGSASFEMLRYLTERLPAMITPKWVDTRIQPIAVRDVLRYLVGAASLPDDVNRRFDIGGPDILT